MRLRAVHENTPNRATLVPGASSRARERRRAPFKGNNPRERQIADAMGLLCNANGESQSPQKQMRMHLRQRVLRDEIPKRVPRAAPWAGNGSNHTAHSIKKNAPGRNDRAPGGVIVHAAGVYACTDQGREASISAKKRVRGTLDAGMIQKMEIPVFCCSASFGCPPCGLILF